MICTVNLPAPRLWQAPARQRPEIQNRMMMNNAINPPTPCFWQAPASTQKTKKGNQAGHHSSEHAVEGQNQKRKTRPAIRRSARWRVCL